MSESGSFKRDKEGINRFIFIFFCLVYCLVLILYYLSGESPVKKGELADSDCYMHLIRVSDLYDTGRWYDPVLIRSNTPYGEKLHWSRPFDVLLLLGAVPISLLTDFESALFLQPPLLRTALVLLF